MKYAIACSAVIPLRQEASEKSEMLTQIMFGEHVEVLKLAENWANIRNAYDGYSGWIDKKTLVEISKIQFTDQCFGWFLRLRPKMGLEIFASR